MFFNDFDEVGALDLCVPLFACSNANGKKDVV